MFKLLFLLIIVGGLVGGAFFLGYQGETSQEEKKYAEQMMQDRTPASRSNSIGAYGN